MVWFVNLKSCQSYSFYFGKFPSDDLVFYKTAVRLFQSSDSFLSSSTLIIQSLSIWSVIESVRALSKQYHCSNSNSNLFGAEDILLYSTQYRFELDNIAKLMRNPFPFLYKRSSSGSSRRSDSNLRSNIAYAPKLVELTWCLHWSTALFLFTWRTSNGCLKLKSFGESVSNLRLQNFNQNLPYHFQNFEFFIWRENKKCLIRTLRQYSMDTVTCKMLIRLWCHF